MVAQEHSDINSAVSDNEHINGRSKRLEESISYTICVCLFFVSLFCLWLVFVPDEFGFRIVLIVTDKSGDLSVSSVDNYIKQLRLVLLCLNSLNLSFYINGLNTLILTIYNLGSKGTLHVLLLYLHCDNPESFNQMP